MMISPGSIRALVCAWAVVIAGPSCSGRVGEPTPPAAPSQEAAPEDSESLESEVPFDTLESSTDPFDVDGMPDSEGMPPSDSPGESAECAPPLLLCDNLCVDLSSNAQHCGGCNQPCAPLQGCHNGSCACECAPGLNCCGAICTDLSTDPENCGLCGWACAAGQKCANGTCSVCPCAAPLSCCDAVCVDLMTDSNHCGGCGNTCYYGPCEQGGCTGGCFCSSQNLLCCKYSCDACGAGYQCCVDACVDLSTDTKNCGTCGHLCFAGQVCTGGTCN